MTNNYFSGMDAKINSSYLESKIIGGTSAREEHTYVASLQLNGIHICASGLFQERFLLTIGPCASYMLDGINNKNKTGTAVLGNVNMRKGQRADILNILYISHEANDERNVGVVMVSWTNMLGCMIQ